MTRSEELDLIEWLKKSMTIEIKSETNDFMSTDGSTRTSFEIKINVNGEEICSDTYYG